MRLTTGNSMLCGINFEMSMRNSSERASQGKASFPTVTSSVETEYPWMKPVAEPVRLLKRDEH